MVTPRAHRRWIQPLQDGASVAALLLLLAFAAVAPARAGQPPPDNHQASAVSPPPAPVPELGALSFPTSGRPAAHREFLIGVAWLHSFEYEEALEAFQRAQRLDRSFAMAYWGEAMCYNQTLWRHENRDEARRILERLGPTPAARAAKAPTARERAYLSALDVLFGDGEKPARDRAYADAMAALAARFPEDDEAAVLHGLSVMATVERGLETMRGDNDDPSTVALIGSEAQRAAADIFKGVLARNPQHPGALHYLIHVYDDPAHAALALEAARRYPSVAPASSHALHMPSHIFFQLGHWAEAITTDELSFATSDAWVRRKGLPLAMRDHHGLTWLIYEYLQVGRFRDAFATIGRLEPVAIESNQPRLKSLSATMTARYAIDSEDWTFARGPQVRNTDEAFAVGVSAARRGDITLADLARDYLARASNEPRYQRVKPFLLQMEKEVDAVARFAEGRSEEALARLAEAAAIEAELPTPIGPPAPVKPSFELYADLLLDAGRLEEAERQYRASLSRWTNRSRSILGIARAAALRGNQAAAREHYTKFLGNWRNADPGLPETIEARDYLERGTVPQVPRIPRLRMEATDSAWWPVAAAGLGLLAAGAGVVWWVRQPRAKSRQQRRAGRRRG